MADPTIRHLDVCAGIGGFSLGLRLADPRVRAVGYCDREAWCAALLLARMEDETLEPGACLVRRASRTWTAASSAVKSICSRLDTRASRTARQGSGRATTTSERSGPRWLASFARSSLLPFSWRTSHGRPCTDPRVIFRQWAISSRRPRCSPPRSWVRGILASAGLLLPTATASQSGYNQGGGSGRVGRKRPSVDVLLRTALAAPKGPCLDSHGVPDLEKTLLATATTKDDHRARMRYGRISQRELLATATVKGDHNRAGASARSGNGLSTQLGGSVNPAWRDWFMGFPLGWTDTSRRATRSFQRWLRLHGRGSSGGRR